MALVISSVVSGVDFGTSTTDYTVVNGDSTNNDSVVSYRDVNVPANCTWTLGLRSVIKISGILTVNGTILGSQTGAGSGIGNSGSGSLTYQSGNVTMRAGDGGGGGGHRFSGGTTQNVNSGGGNTTAGGSAYNNVTSLAATSSFSAQLQNGSSGGSGAGAGSGSTGGSGGAGGGAFRIMAKDITVNSGGVISARGAKGGNGTGGTYEDGGGGGGGGSGGTAWIIAGRISGTGAINADGGAGGNGGQGNQGANGTGGGGGSCGYVRLDIGIWGATQPTTTSLRYTSNNFSTNFTNEAAIVTTGTYVVALDDATAPSIGTPVNSFTAAGSNQNQIVTVSISDTQTAVSNPTAVFQTVTGTNSGTVTLTSFTSGTATFTVSNQTGSGTARIFITAVDAAGNSATAYSPVWTIDNSPPSGYTPFFGDGTTDWIIDGTATNAGISTWQDENAGVHYYVTDCWNETGTHTVNLRNLEIANNFKLEWKGVLILNVKNTATINGTLGWGMHNVNVQVYGRVINGGGRSGTGGRYDDNTGNPGWNGWGYSASGAYGAYGGSGGGGGSQGNDPGGGNGGQHLYRVPISADTRTTVISRGVAIGNGGGGGGAANGTGGTGGYGGGGLILFAQTLSGSGIIDVSGTRGRDPQTLNTEYNGAGGGGGAGGHVVAIVGTSNFANGKIYASGGGGGVGAYWSSEDGRYNHTSPSGGSASNGYINFYYNTGSLPSTVFPEIINTVKTDTTIPATIADNQPSVTSALLSSGYRKNGQVQRISISYSKTMTDSEVKITLSGAATLASAVMTKAASPANTYYYDYTNQTGNGIINYSIAAKDNVLNPAAVISGSWILDNTAPSFTSSISPNKTFFLGGESISYTITGTEANSMASVPSISLVAGSDFYGTSPPTVNLTTSSVSGSTSTYSSYTRLPTGIGTISATVSGTDVAANTGTNSGLSTIKLLPPSGMLWS